MSILQQRVPVSILTGFLGAGKSTLLNRILKDAEMRDAAVIINEFGDVGIDHLLERAPAIPSSSSPMAASAAPCAVSWWIRWRT